MGSRNRRPARRDLSAERDDFLNSLRGPSNIPGRAKNDYRAVMFCRRLHGFNAQLLENLVVHFARQGKHQCSLHLPPSCNHLLVHLGIPSGLAVPMIEILVRITRTLRPVLVYKSG